MQIEDLFSIESLIVKVSAVDGDRNYSFPLEYLLDLSPPLWDSKEVEIEISEDFANIKWPTARDNIKTEYYILKIYINERLLLSENFSSNINSFRFDISEINQDALMKVDVQASDGENNSQIITGLAEIEGTFLGNLFSVDTTTSSSSTTTSSTTTSSSSTTTVQVQLLQVQFNYYKFNYYKLPNSTTTSSSSTTTSSSSTTTSSTTVQLQLLLQLLQHCKKMFAKINVLVGSL